jgi:uncharacterized protein with FMN-binding domain
MKTKKLVCGARNLFFALAVIFALAFIGCPTDPEDGPTGPGGLPDLGGKISFTVIDDPTKVTGYTTGDELSVSYNGTETISYQWYKDGEAIDGETGQRYTPIEAGTYTVTISAAGYNPKTSDPITVTGSTLSRLSGTISITPDSGVVVGDELEAVYTGEETVTYQWYKDGVAILNETNETYTPDDVGIYTVRVSADGYASKTSAAVTVEGLAVKLAKILEEAEDGESYTIELSADEAIGPQTLDFYGLTNITITLKGIGGEKVISLLESETGSLFNVGTFGNSSVTLILDENITLQGHENNNEPLVYVNYNSTLEMNAGAKITGNANTSYSLGGGVYVNSNGTFTMSGGEISGNSASNGGGVYVAYGGTFTMSDGEISGNTGGIGGGVYLMDATFTLEDGKITGNTTRNYGGGVYVGDTGNETTFFIMKGGEISDNTGGGVYLSSGTFTMEDGEISGNTSGDGGGVYVSSGTFTMSDGKISGNISEASGGGVSVGSPGTFIMEGGEISGNTANSTNYGGGGVFVIGNGDKITFIMKDGKITGNTADSGGGVYVFGLTFLMEGGEISGNTANATASTGSPGGGGVYVYQGYFRIVTGTIYGSDATDGLANTATGVDRGAALYMAEVVGITAEYGTFNANDEWTKAGDLETTDETIEVTSGVKS